MRLSSLSPGQVVAHGYPMYTTLVLCVDFKVYIILLYFLFFFFFFVQHDPLGIQIDMRPSSLSPGQAGAPVRKHSIEGEALSPVFKNLELKG